MKKLLFICLLFASIGGFARHPVHLSITNMEFDADSLKVNYSIRLFQEDVFTLFDYLSHEELH